MEFEAATAGQGRKAGGGRGSRKQAAAPPKTRVSGAGRPTAAGGRAGGKAAAAAAAPQGGSAAAAALRHAADPGLQSPAGKRRPGESRLNAQYVGSAVWGLSQAPCARSSPAPPSTAFIYKTTHTMVQTLFHTSVVCFRTGAQVLRGPAVTPKRQKTAAAVPKRAENEEHAVAMAEARAVANQEVRSASIVTTSSFKRLQM